MSAFATVDDFTVRTGQSSLSMVQAGRVTALLDDASALVRSQLPPGYDPPADLAKAITVTMVIRATTNPGGLRSKTVGGVSATYDQDGGLYLTDDELALLLSGLDENSSGAYTVGVHDAAFPPWNQRMFDHYAYRDRRELYEGWSGC
jgi:hypothetical protein